MRATPSDLPEVLIVEPTAHSDQRGFFLELWQAERYADIGIGPRFVQDNLSRSTKDVLRGLHFQEPGGQGKLVSVVEGAVLDVAVDVRRSSPRFARWIGVELTAENRKQIWIPPGFAHGFCVLSAFATVHYKCTEFFEPAHERTVRWNDPAIGIAWPVREPILSERDRLAPSLEEAPVLPSYEGA